MYNFARKVYVKDYFERTGSGSRSATLASTVLHRLLLGEVNLVLSVSISMASVQQYKGKTEKETVES
jgi:hypothetical protein